MYNFCTLFDKNYLFKGLTLYKSLLDVCPDFKLWILCMDNTVYDVLTKFNLPKINLISLNEFEDEELLRIKNTRTQGEYCWTCTPSLPLYIMDKNNIDMVIYLDADLYFYSDPEPVFTEFGDDSILMIEHKYSSVYKKYEEISGKYNVQFLIFRNNIDARDCLTWWRKKCIEWCFMKLEKGKLGDQQYLEAWPEKFNGVHILQHKGGGVAPWNVQQYKIEEKNNKLFIDGEELIFFHFHQLNILSPVKYDLTKGYILPGKAIELIYKPYIYRLKETINFVKSKDNEFNYGYNVKHKYRPSSLKSYLKLIIEKNKVIEWFFRKYIGKIMNRGHYVYEIND